MQKGSAAVIERHRYLEVLHEFTMRQASMKSVDDICWNIAKQQLVNWALSIALFIS